MRLEETRSFLVVNCAIFFQKGNVSTGPILVV
jgi:hypothetical protein